MIGDATQCSIFRWIHIIFGIPILTVGRHFSQSTLTMCVLAVVCLATSCLSGHAAVSNYTSFASFESVVGPQPLIRFTEVPLGTAPTDEYLGWRYAASEVRRYS